MGEFKDMELSELRKQIDAIDDELVSLAKSIDRRYAELYVTSNALPEVEKYLKDHE